MLAGLAAGLAAGTARAGLATGLVAAGLVAGRAGAVVAAGLAGIAGVAVGCDGISRPASVPGSVAPRDAAAPEVAGVAALIADSEGGEVAACADPRLAGLATESPSAAGEPAVGLSAFGALLAAERPMPARSLND